MSVIAAEQPLDVGALWRKVRYPVVLILIGLALVTVLAAIGAEPNTAPLDPRSTAPDGAHALSVLLGNRGIAVTVANSVDQLDSSRDTTVLLSAPSQLSISALRTIAASAATVVAVDPAEDALSALGVAASPDAQIAATTLEPGCAVKAAVTAGSARISGDLYAAPQPASATGAVSKCYSQQGDAALLETTRPNQARTIVLGSSSTLSNAHLASEGDAALALGLLDNHAVQWVPGGLHAGPAPKSRRGLFNLLPSRLLWATLQLFIAVVVLALWRSRRLGRPVVEPLPVVVRAAETVEGRARLMQAARARDVAARSLRGASIRRLTRAMRLGADDDPAAVVGLVAERTGTPAGERDPLAALRWRAARRRGTGPPRSGAAPPRSRRTPRPRTPTWRSARDWRSDVSPAARQPRAVSAEAARESLTALRTEVAKAVVGQDAAVTGLVVAMLCEGHVLLEGVPGVAKTLLVRTLAAALSLESKRVQFTPDLMPGDVTGSLIYDARTAQFEFREGPVFTNLLLADEINRTPPKTQASLLEAMEERQVSVDGQPRPLPSPFLVAATQNPVEYEGTYTLPEAQLDRFLLKLTVPLPERDDEISVLARHDDGFDPRDLAAAGVRAVAGPAELRAARAAAAGVRTAPDVMGYIVDICRATRTSPSLSLGASPRGATALLATSKAWAWLSGRDYVTPDDVKALARPTLRHRVSVRPEAELEGVNADGVLDGVLAAVPVPR